MAGWSTALGSTAQAMTPEPDRPGLRKHKANQRGDPLVFDLFGENQRVPLLVWPTKQNIQKTKKHKNPHNPKTTQKTPKNKTTKTSAHALNSEPGRPSLLKYIPGDP